MNEMKERHEITKTNEMNATTKTYETNVMN